MNSPSCWCASRTLTDRLRRHLAERYTGCLCPECLDRLIREDATETEKNGG
jgi:ribosomal protein L34E